MTDADLIREARERMHKFARYDQGDESLIRRLAAALEMRGAELERANSHPREAYTADYETLIRLARRCAYDLAHVVGDLKPDSYFREANFQERSDWWVALFAKGNPGKDYRTDQHRTIDRLDGDLDRAHAQIKVATDRALAAEARADRLAGALTEALWIDKEPIVRILQDYADEDNYSRRFVADRIIELLRSAAKLASLDAALTPAKEPTKS